MFMFLFLFFSCPSLDHHPHLNIQAKENGQRRNGKIILGGPARGIAQTGWFALSRTNSGGFESLAGGHLSAHPGFQAVLFLPDTP